jgi:hypothetical protein
MAWVLRLVETGIDRPPRVIDVLDIRPRGDLGDIANLGLTLSEAKQILPGLQQTLVAIQTDDHAVQRPVCSSCRHACDVKDWRLRRVTTLFGTVAMRLPRFRCAGCGHRETGINWLPYCRSTPELDQLRAQARRKIWTTYPRLSIMNTAVLLLSLNENLFLCRCRYGHPSRRQPASLHRRCVVTLAGWWCLDVSRPSPGHLSCFGRRKEAYEALHPETKKAPPAETMKASFAKLANLKPSVSPPTPPRKPASLNVRSSVTRRGAPEISGGPAIDRKCPKHS